MKIKNKISIIVILVLITASIFYYRYLDMKTVRTAGICNIIKSSLLHYRQENGFFPLNDKDQLSGVFNLVINKNKLTKDIINPDFIDDGFLIHINKSNNDIIIYKRIQSFPVMWVSSESINWFHKKPTTVAYR